MTAVKLATCSDVLQTQKNKALCSKKFKPVRKHIFSLRHSLHPSERKVETEEDSLASGYLGVEIRV